MRKLSSECIDQRVLLQRVLALVLGNSVPINPDVPMSVGVVVTIGKEKKGQHTARS